MTTAELNRSIDASDRSIPKPEEIALLEGLRDNPEVMGEENIGLHLFGIFEKYGIEPFYQAYCVYPTSEQQEIFLQTALHKISLEVGDDPTEKLPREKEMRKSLNMLGLYWLTPYSLEQIGNVVGDVTRERVRQRVVDATALLAEFASNQDLNELKHFKGGIWIDTAVRLVKQGKPFERVVESLDLTMHQISHLREVLRQAGYSHETLLLGQSAYYERKIRQFDRLSQPTENLHRQKRNDSALRNFFEANWTHSRSFKDRLLRDGLIDLVKNLINESSDYQYNNRRLGDIIEALEKEIPLPILETINRTGVLRYHFYLTNQRERLKQLIDQKAQKDSRFKKLLTSKPVIQIGDTDSKELPSTYKLQTSSQYIAIGNILKQVGLHHNTIKYQKLVSSSPVKIFRLDNRYYLHVDDLGEFIGHVFDIKYESENET